MSTAGDLQVVTFSLDQEAFAVPVVLVREILDYRDTCHIPNGPAFMLGLADVRGLQVPTIDLRLKLGLPRFTPTLTTRILVVDVPLPDRMLTMGLVVDRVLDVKAIDSDRIEGAPDVGVGWQSAYIGGVIRHDDRFLVLIDLPCIFSAGDAAMLQPFGRRAANRAVAA